MQVNHLQPHLPIRKLFILHPPPYIVTMEPLTHTLTPVWDAKPSPPSPLLSPSSSTNSPPHPQPPQKINWVELKTTAELRDHPQSHANFTRKLLKFWAQSFLLGVPKIIVGFRTNDIEGRLLRIQEFETTKIPRMVREQMQGSGEGWEMGVCVNFTGLLLDCMFMRWCEGLWRVYY